MELKFVQTIILYCLHKLDGERTIYSIYHLLNGKKSSQTIQDAHLYHLSIFFQTDTKIDREYLEHTVAEFLENELIVEISEQHYLVTAKGVKVIETFFSERPIPPHLNGWKYQRKAEIFWERMTLAVQVISYLQKNDAKYIPLQKKTETLSWMKHFLHQNQLDRGNLGKKLYNELVICLESSDHVNPNVVVLRLSGYRSIGLTSTQAAERLQMEASYYHYQFLALIHYLIKYIEENAVRLPLLSAMLNQVQQNQLTLSTEKTFALLKQGYSVSEIMTIRHLKKSTIEDHLVELALQTKEFSIDPYVSIEKQQLILKAVNSIKTKQLKQIRNLVAEADYFEIRLVLAKFGGE